MKPWLITSSLYCTERKSSGSRQQPVATAAASGKKQQWQQPLASCSAMAIFAKRSRPKQAAPAASDGRHNSGGRQQARQQQQQPASFLQAMAIFAKRSSRRVASPANISSEQQWPKQAGTKKNYTGGQRTITADCYAPSGKISRFPLKTVSWSDPCWLANP